MPNESLETVLNNIKRHLASKRVEQVWEDDEDVELVPSPITSISEGHLEPRLDEDGSGAARAAFDTLVGFLDRTNSNKISAKIESEIQRQLRCNQELRQSLEGVLLNGVLSSRDFKSLVEDMVRDVVAKEVIPMFKKREDQLLKNLLKAFDQS